MEGVTDKSPGRSWVFGSLHSHQRSSRACSTFPLSIYCIFLFFLWTVFLMYSKSEFPRYCYLYFSDSGIWQPTQPSWGHPVLAPLFPPSPPYKQCIITMYNVSQGVTTCGLSSLASFLKILSSKHVCCVFRDIRDKYAVNQGFWSKTAVFSLSATKVHCLLIFWLPHLYNLLQPEDPGVRTEDRGLRTED